MVLAEGPLAALRPQAAAVFSGVAGDQRAGGAGVTPASRVWPSQTTPASAAHSVPQASVLARPARLMEPQLPDWHLGARGGGWGEEGADPPALRPALTARGSPARPRPVGSRSELPGSQLLGGWTSPLLWWRPGGWRKAALCSPSDRPAGSAPHCCALRTSPPGETVRGQPELLVWDRRPPPPHPPPGMSLNKARPSQIPAPCGGNGAGGAVGML